MTAAVPVRVLVVCWGSSARSIMAEAEERVEAFRRVYTDLGVRIHQFLPLAERFAGSRSPVELA